MQRVPVRDEFNESIEQYGMRVRSREHARALADSYPALSAFGRTRLLKEPGMRPVQPPLQFFKKGGFFGKKPVARDGCCFGFSAFGIAGGGKQRGVNCERGRAQRTARNIQIFVNRQRLRRAALFQSSQRKQRTMRKACGFAGDETLSEALNSLEFLVIGYWRLAVGI